MSDKRQNKKSDGCFGWKMLPNFLCSNGDLTKLTVQPHTSHSHTEQYFSQNTGQSVEECRTVYKLKGEMGTKKSKSKYGVIRTSEETAKSSSPVPGAILTDTESQIKVLQAWANFSPASKRCPALPLHFLPYKSWKNCKQPVNLVLVMLCFYPHCHFNLQDPS